MELMESLAYAASLPSYDDEDQFRQHSYCRCVA